MKAVCGWARRRCRSRMFRTLKYSIRAMPSYASPPPPSAGLTCTSTMATFRPWSRRYSRPRIHGRGGRGRPAEPGQVEGRRPRRGSFHHRLRQMLLLQGRSSGRCCDNSNPNAWMAEKMIRLFGLRAFWLLAYVRRICRRPGSVCPRAVCRRRSVENS